MSEFRCTLPFKHDKNCGGLMHEIDVAFCLRCKQVQDLINMQRGGRKPYCTKARCGGKLVMAKEYICKECKNTPSMVKVEE